MKTELTLLLTLTITTLCLTSCSLLKINGIKDATKPKSIVVLVNGVDYRCLDVESFKTVLKEAGRE